MERCSNCGAPARADAKYCTTCGFRLPEGRFGDTEPEATWPDAEEPTAADVVETAAAVAPPSTWPAAEEDEAPSWVVPPLHPEPPTAPATDSWGTAANWGNWGTPESSPSAEADDDEQGGSFFPTDVPPTDHEDVVAVVEPPAASVVGVGSETRAYAAAVSAALTERPEAERLRVLLEEAQSLLPALAVPPAPAIDVDAVRADLAAALDANRPDIDDLRAALERARENPRDIDTILDLTGRVDAVILLLDAHDGLRRTVQDVVARLRAGQS